MTNYGKLIKGELIPAPNRVEYNDMVVINPKSEILINLGYKPILYPNTDNDEIIDNYEVVYTDKGDAIEVAYIPTPTPIVDNEALRQEAYRMQADQYLIAYQGYLAEGKMDQADKQKELYLSKKEEIRQQFK